MRRIVTPGPRTRGGDAPPSDGYFDRIMKYIPAEIVAGWVALDGLVGNLSQTALWGLFGVIALFSYFWMLRQTAVPGQPRAVKQAAIAVVSFGVWAFALQSGPFATYVYPTEYGSIAMIVYTLGIGLVVP